MDIDIRHLSYSLKNNRNLFKIKSLNLPYQQKFLITGPSGSGKTTFLHLLAGLVNFIDGDVIFNKSIHLKSLTDQEKTTLRQKNIGLISQDLNLIDYLTVEENLELCLQNQKDKIKITEILKKINLVSNQKQKVKNLSLGEQQRLATARILINNYSIVLADEPTSSLDEANADIIMNLLLQYADNSSLIVVSHDHRIERYFSNHISFKDFKV